MPAFTAVPSSAPAYLLGALAYGYHDVSTSRVVGADTLEANYSAHSFSGRAEAGYRFDTPMIGLAPYLAFQGTSLSIPSYAETASGDRHLRARL